MTNFPNTNENVPLLFQVAYAIDTLAIALTDKNHEWTTEQREAYEGGMSAIRALRSA